MAGPLKTLFAMLRASQYLNGVSLAYGEEKVHDTSEAQPLVVIVPRGGPFLDDPAYSKDLPTYVERQWAVNEAIDLVLWASDPDPLAQPIDHADAIEALRVRVLSALQDQRAMYDAAGDTSRGLWFKAVVERWETMEGAFIRLGRTLVITVAVEIPIPMLPPPDATVTDYTLTATITAGS